MLYMLKNYNKTNSLEISLKKHSKIASEHFLSKNFVKILWINFETKKLFVQFLLHQDSLELVSSGFWKSNLLQMKTIYICSEIYVVCSEIM